MKKLTLLSTAVFFTVALFAQTLDEAKKEIDNENYFKAKQVLFKLINDPAQNKTEVAYYLGNAMLKSDDIDSAKIMYKMVYNPESRSALGYVANGRLALLAKNNADAKANFDRALQTSKMKDANIYYEIGDAYFRPDVIDIAAAIANLEAAYNLNNKNTTIILALGDAYLENSVNDPSMGGKAMNKYEYASDLNKNLAMAWIKIGRLSSRARIYDQAIVSYNKALAIDQRDPLVYKELAMAYYNTRQYDKFKENYQKYLDLSPGDNQAKEFIINVYFTNKEYDKVIEEANKGLINDPNNAVFYRALAYANFELKRYKEAAAAMQQFNNNPNRKERDRDIIYSARIAAATGDTATANRSFKIVLDKDSMNADFLSEYAKMLFTAKQYPAAIEQYNIKKNRLGKLTSTEVYYLGRAYLETGDSLNADTTFAEFITRNPSSPDGYFWRARTNLKLGKAEDFKALPYYQKYLELTLADPVKYAPNANGKLSTIGYNQIESYIYQGVAVADKDKAKAKEYYNKALELDPNDANAIFFMKQLDAPAPKSK